MGIQSPDSAADTDLITIRLDPNCPDLARAWVTEPVCDIVRRCQQARESAVPRRLTILIVLPEPGIYQPQPMACAAVAALRGLIYSLTLESGDALTLNLVIVPNGEEGSAEATLAFLRSGAATWIRGATFDLTEAQWQSL